MPVTIYPSSNAVRGMYKHPDDEKTRKTAKSSYPNSPYSLLGAVYGGKEPLNVGEVFQSTFDNNASRRNDFEVDDGSWIHPSHPGNSFVGAILKAYNHHHHLRLRPDDVWLAIIAQLNLYINAHSEELRHHFVEHEGQKELEVTFFGCNRYTVDFGLFAKLITEQLHENVKDPAFVTWILPDFSTTTTTDTTTACVLAMATLQTYFTYTCRMLCGLPAVTLLGTRDDWASLLSRIESTAFLTSFGPETAQWSKLLVPVLRGFVATFDEPESSKTSHFWQRVCHKFPYGSGTQFLSGWITAFTFFDREGAPLYNAAGMAKRIDERESRLQRQKEAEELGIQFGTASSEGEKMENERKVALEELGSGMCELDGVLYHQIDLDEIPPSFGDVPVKVDDNGLVMNCKMVAGVVAYRISSSGIEDKDAREKWRNRRALDKYGSGNEEEGTGVNDQIAPQPGWWMYKYLGETEE